MAVRISFGLTDIFVLAFVVLKAVVGIDAENDSRGGFSRRLVLPQNDLLFELREHALAVANILGALTKSCAMQVYSCQISVQLTKHATLAQMSPVPNTTV